MTIYTPDWELDTIPDEAHFREHGRRTYARMKNKPNPPILRPCVQCGKMLNTRQRAVRCACGCRPRDQK